MHLKYRPTSLGEFMGNSQVKNALSSLDYKSPIFFEGETGCGKTTLSYIVAKNYGANPLTIREINCGYYTKIEDMRKEIDDLGQSSFFGDKKVLILSEIHKLSPASQNAWLIPLENLPKSVLVIGNTIYTESLLEEFMDRFLRFRVKSLTEKESLVLLGRVCKAEEIELPKWLQMLLLEKSEGIPRRLLVGLAKVRDVEDKNEARFLLDVGIVEEAGEVIELFKILQAKGSWKIVRKKLSILLKDNSPDSVRISLMNIISGHIMSNYFKTDSSVHGEKLSRLFFSLKAGVGVPDKANLIMSIFREVLTYGR